MTDDINFMRHALLLARRNLGQTWPNPSVGCVIVKEGKIVGSGATARGGKPHAETQALEQAEDKARGATAYVTLEPCAHVGTTPACSEELAKAGITRVVIACTDPDPRTNGKGIAKLKAAGIEVTESVLQKEAEKLNAGFFSVIQKQRPFASVKIATTRDGKIPHANSKNRFVTSEPARNYVQRLRAEHDAILTGIGTVLADNPLLTCRLPGMEDRSPVRIIMDTKLQTPATCQLVTTAQQIPTWIITSESSLKSKQAATLQKNGVRLISTPLQEKHISIPATLELLAKEGITRLFVETGPTLSAAFIEENCCDQLYWFHSPVTMQEKNPQSYDATLAITRQMQCTDTIPIGEDTLEVYSS